MRRWPTLVALLAGLAVPATASAATEVIDGSPLNVFVSDDGRLQARFDGEATGEFWPPASDTPNAGFMLALPGTQNFGFLDTPFTPGGVQTGGGDGTPSNPFTVHAFYAAGSISIHQITTYVNSTRTFSVRYELLNNDSLSSPTVRPTLSADLFINGNDFGVGFLEGSSPNRIVGGVNEASGASGGIVEDTPWAKFEESGFSTVFTHARDFSSDGSGGFTNSVLSSVVDNGVGIQWQDVTLPTLQTEPTVFEATWRFTRFDALSLSPTTFGLQAGQTHTVVARAQTRDGVAARGRTIRFSIAGANPGSGVVTTGGDGSASISWIGANPGTDTLTAFTDLNGNGTRDSVEPQEQATAEWTPAPGQPQQAQQQQQPQQDPPARRLTIDDLSNPDPFREVNIEPVEGQVFVRLPGGSARASQSGTPRGFIPLNEAAQIPIRSIVDTSRGKVRMESAFSATGRTTQTAEFFDGQFQVLQSRARKPITEVVLKGGSFRGCPRARQSASWSRANGQDAQRRRRARRRLWGSGRGRFRTRGRYSSATVRGTTWLVEDRCDGTLTRLPRRPRTSVVDVRDLTRRRTIRLRAGRSYLARPRAARRR